MKQACSGVHANGFPPGAPIPGTTTLDELRKMSPAEVIATLGLKAERVILDRYGQLGPFFYRPMRFPEVGSVITGHVHKADHNTEVQEGSLLLRAREFNWATSEGFGPIIERVYEKGADIFIPKDWLHEFTSLVPNTKARCVFVNVDPVTGLPTSVWHGNVEDFI